MADGTGVRTGSVSFVQCKYVKGSILGRQTLWTDINTDEVTLWNSWFWGTTTTPTGRVKVWDGSAWNIKPTKVWSGSAWVTKPTKVWNGSSWV